MKLTSLILAASQAFAPAYAGGEVGRFESPQMTIVLTDLQEDCPPGLTLFFGAHSRRGMFQGCWRMDADGDIFLDMGPEGSGFVPGSKFKFSKGKP